MSERQPRDKHDSLKGEKRDDNENNKSICNNKVR